MWPQATTPNFIENAGAGTNAIGVLCPVDARASNCKTFYPENMNWSRSYLVFRLQHQYRFVCIRSLIFIHGEDALDLS